MFLSTTASGTWYAWSGCRVWCWCMELTCVCVCVVTLSSREKQRQLKEASHSPHGSVSPVASDTEPDAASKASAELQVSAAQKRLTKHRWALKHVSTSLFLQQLNSGSRLNVTPHRLSRLSSIVLAPMDNG